MKVVVAGAAGGIGQPLSLLFKLSPYVDELSLYDVVNSPGVAQDLAHISTSAKTAGFLPADNGIKDAFTGAQLVVIPAGIPRKPGMTRDDLFKINAGIVRDLVQGVADHCPDAFVLIISNPVNSTVPIAAEVLKKAGVFNPKKLFGVTTLDVVRANTFVAELNSGKPEDYAVPVIGGHSGKTIVPLISLGAPDLYKKLSSEELDALINHIQFGGDEVVKAKSGLGSATLSMAYAGFKFSESILKAAAGESVTPTPSFVYLPGVPGGEAIAKELGVDFFALPVELGKDGVTGIKNVLPEVSEGEKKLIEEAVAELKGSITKGAEFVTGPKI